MAEHLNAEDAEVLAQERRTSLMSRAQSTTLPALVMKAVLFMVVFFRATLRKPLWPLR